MVGVRNFLQDPAIACIQHLQLRAQVGKHVHCNDLSAVGGKIGGEVTASASDPSFLSAPEVQDPDRL